MAITTINIKNVKGEQEIHIPQNMRINDDMVYVKQIGNSLFLIPYHNAWQNLIASTNAFTNDFMDDRNEPNQQKRNYFD